MTFAGKRSLDFARDDITNALCLHPERSGTLPAPHQLPISIRIGRILHAVTIQPFNHLVKSRLPEVIKPFRFAEPFYQRGADCIVCTDKSASVPRFGKSIVSIAAERPNLRAVIRTIDCCCDIAAAGWFRQRPRRRC